MRRSEGVKRFQLRSADPAWIPYKNQESNQPPKNLERIRPQASTVAEIKAEVKVRLHGRKIIADKIAAAEKRAEERRVKIAKKAARNRATRLARKSKKSN
jgi:soluble cytochrome b562